MCSKMHFGALFGKIWGDDKPTHSQLLQLIIDIFIPGLEIRGCWAHGAPLNSLAARTGIDLVFLGSRLASLLL